MTQTEHLLADRLGLPIDALSLVAVVQSNQAAPGHPPRILTNGIYASSEPLTDDFGQSASHLLCNLDNHTPLTFLSEARAQAFIDLSWEQQHHPDHPYLTLDLSDRWLSLTYVQASSNLPLDNPHARYEVLLQAPIEYKGINHSPGTIIGTHLDDPHFQSLIQHSSHIRFI